MQVHIQRQFPYTTLLLTVIFLLGLVLRLGWIDAHGLWSDEISSIITARNGLPFIFANRYGWLGNQSTWHYVIIWLVSLPLDPAASPLLVRLPSALAGAFLPLVVYGLGRELFSRTTGLVAAFMAAVSPVLLDYSHDARPYSLLAFLTAASVYCLIMAERTGKAGWWIGFVSATVANLLNAYVAVTLVMPALAPYIAWMMWRTWQRRRGDGKRNLIAMLISFGLVALAGVVMLFEVMRMPRTAIDWTKLSLTSPLSIADKLQAWFSDFGLSGLATPTVSLFLLLLAIAGMLMGIRAGRVRGVVLCTLLCFVPVILLALLATTNIIFQRYVLFIGPFYFLFVGNGAAILIELAQRPAVKGLQTGALRAGALATLGFVLVVSSTGAINYARPETHALLSYRPDFRGIASYLTRVVHTGDMIAMADDPGLGVNVAGFYWHDSPPAPLFDARDPMLFRQVPDGDIYWVVSSLDPYLLSLVGEDRPEWAGLVHFERAVVVHQARNPGAPALNVAGGLSHLADIMSPAVASERYILTLRGSVYQAQGNIAAAADAYHRAGNFLPLADEYLRTANGYAALGWDKQAWREVIIAKSVQPYDPGVHSWLAGRLSSAGYAQEGGAEAQIAAALRVSAGYTGPVGLAFRSPQVAFVFSGR